MQAHSTPCAQEMRSTVPISTPFGPLVNYSPFSCFQVSSRPLAATISSGKPPSGKPIGLKPYSSTQGFSQAPTAPAAMPRLATTGHWCRTEAGQPTHARGMEPPASPFAPEQPEATETSGPFKPGPDSPTGSMPRSSPQPPSTPPQAATLSPSSSWDHRSTAAPAPPAPIDPTAGSSEQSPLPAMPAHGPTGPAMPPRRLSSLRSFQPSSGSHSASPLTPNTPQQELSEAAAPPAGPHSSAPAALPRRLSSLRSFQPPSRPLFGSDPDPELALIQQTPPAAPVQPVHSRTSVPRAASPFLAPPVLRPAAEPSDSYHPASDAAGPFKPLTPTSHAGSQPSEQSSRPTGLPQSAPRPPSRSPIPAGMPPRPSSYPAAGPQQAGHAGSSSQPTSMDQPGVAALAKPPGLPRLNTRSSFQSKAWSEPAQASLPPGPSLPSRASALPLSDAALLSLQQEASAPAPQLQPRGSLSRKISGLPFNAAPSTDQAAGPGRIGSLRSHESGLSAPAAPQHASLLPGTGILPLQPDSHHEAHAPALGSASSFRSHRSGVSGPAYEGPMPSVPEQPSVSSPRPDEQLQQGLHFRQAGSELPTSAQGSQQQSSSTGGPAEPSAVRRWHEWAGHSSQDTPASCFPGFSSPEPEAPTYAQPSSYAAELNTSEAATGSEKGSAEAAGLRSASAGEELLSFDVPDSAVNWGPWGSPEIESAFAQVRLTVSKDDTVLLLADSRHTAHAGSLHLMQYVQLCCNCTDPSAEANLLGPWLDAASGDGIEQHRQMVSLPTAAD